jgi:stress response protein YsnF
MAGMESALARDVEKARSEEWPVWGSDGELVGRVDGVFQDYRSGEPAWVRVRSEADPSQRRLVPADGLTFHSRAVRVPYTPALVFSTPRIEGDEIGADTEAVLRDRYGLERADPTAETVVAPVVGAEREEAAIVRSEEELVVDKRTVEAGRVSLRKWVETEPVTQEIELVRETGRVVREPIDRVVEDGNVEEAEIEITFYVEEPVVEKRLVARERISLEKDVERHVETVSDTVQVERVDVEGDAEKETTR